LDVEREMKERSPLPEGFLKMKSRSCLKRRSSRMRMEREEVLVLLTMVDLILCALSRGVLLLLLLSNAEVSAVWW
jgi:hypothetical protein